jgi:hypothetical protein
MDKLNGRKTKVRLGKGTQMNLPSTDVIVVDCSKIDLEDLVEGAEEVTE